MAEQQVRYTLLLKDLLTNQVNTATTATKGLSSAMSTAKGVLGALGVGFGVFQGLSFVHSGIEAFEKLHQAEAQVEAGLKSTGYAAGLTAHDLEEMAKKTSAGVKYSRAEITDLQSLMLTFPAITKKTFPEATQTILDMSTRLGQDTKSSAIQLGKALQDPIRGVTALRRVGVNFTESQTEMIKKMVDSGQSAKAQALILKELQVEFGGSAKAAFEADPLAQYNKMMGSVKMGVGELAMNLLVTLKPALETVAGLFKSGITWIKENKTLLKALAVGVGVLAGAWALYSIPALAASAATTLLTGAFTALSFIFSISPIGWVVIGLAALSAGLYYAWEKSEAFRGAVLGLWEVIKGFARFVYSIGSGIANIFAGWWNSNPSQVIKGINDIKDAWKNFDISKDYEKGVMSAHQAAKKKVKEDKGLGQAIAPAVGGEGEAKDGKEKKDTSAKGATGQKVYTINIKIDSLVKEQIINTTTLKEGAGKIKDMVTEVLLAAVNDSQMIAER